VARGQDEDISGREEARDVVALAEHPHPLAQSQPVAEATDVVLERPLPPALVARADALLGCLGAASVRADYLAALGCAGFRAVRVVRERPLLATVDFEDPRMQQAIARLGITDADAAKFVAAVTTLHVFGLK
jgi:hypothetical protein